jgi:hypothetical protein
VRVSYDEGVANHIDPEKGLAAPATGHVLAVWETVTADIPDRQPRARTASCPVRL